MKNFFNQDPLTIVFKVMVFCFIVGFGTSLVAKSLAPYVEDFGNNHEEKLQQLCIDATKDRMSAEEAEFKLIRMTALKGDHFIVSALNTFAGSPELGEHENFVCEVKWNGFLGNSGLTLVTADEWVDSEAEENP